MRVQNDFDHQGAAIVQPVEAANADSEFPEGRAWGEPKGMSAIIVLDRDTMILRHFCVLMGHDNFRTCCRRRSGADKGACVPVWPLRYGRSQLLLIE